MTSKKNWLPLAGIYLFFYILNYLHPLNFGDDYIYSFVWQGNSMFVPLTEDAVRVNSFKDLFISQWTLYFTWGGRTIGQLFTQFFLWMGKGVFDIFNSLIATILVVEIYWCFHKGRVNFDFNSGTLCWILFLLWAFTPAFSTVFLWLTAACIYLWTHVILLAFLFPYIQKYYCPTDKKFKSLLLSTVMLFWGIIAGWTNENSICWVLVLLLIFNYQSWKKDKYERWMGLGFLGLLIGYALLMLAPGNVVRLQLTYGFNWFNLSKLIENLHMLVVVLTFQLFLWYFNLRSIYSLKKKGVYSAQDYLFVKILCGTAFGTIITMLFSPFFPARSGFFGTILLIVAAGVLLRMQDETRIVLIGSRIKKVFLFIGVFYFVMTFSVTLNSYYKINLQMQDIIASAKQYSIYNNTQILTVTSFKETSKLIDMMSGFHIPDYILSEDEKDWKNVDFSRYYQIRGVRMIK